MGEGNKKLSKRDPESNLFLHRERGFTPEGLLNYLVAAGLGPSSADRDVFSRRRARRGVRRRRRQPEPGALRPEEGRGDQRRRTCACSRPRTSATASSRTCTHAGLVPADSFADLSAQHQALLTASAPARAGAHDAARRGRRDARLPVRGRRRAARSADDARAALREESAAVLDAAAAVLADLPDVHDRADAGGPAGRARSTRAGWRSSRGSPTRRCAWRSRAVASRRRCSSRWSCSAASPRSPAIAALRATL